MNSKLAVGALSIAALWVLWRSFRPSYSFGGEPIHADGGVLNRDPYCLIPSFAARLELLFWRMRARGFQPYLLEACRSKERAALLAKRGDGIEKSLHRVGAAVDIVSKDKTDPYTPGFYAALEQEVEKLGLVSGRSWTRSDPRHVQAIAVYQEPAFWALDPDLRAEFVSAQLQATKIV